jgi:hypothetical protein
VAEGDAANPAINIHRLPDGKALAGVISRVARRQREAILKAIRGNLEAALKAVPIGGKKALDDLPGIDWSAWDEEFAKNCAPVMQLYAEDGAHKVNVRLGATDEEAAWRVQLPQVREAVQKAAMQFAESTNATTSLQLDQAIVKLREDLAAGILEGPNTLRDLTKRVEAIFTGLEGDRARMIALTESSRAVHQGQLIAAEQSGMVQGMKWLAHPGACDACQEMAAEERDLGESFADDGAGGPYSVVDMPPLHPNCLCTVTEVLKPLGELLAAADQLGDGFRPEE